MRNFIIGFSVLFFALSGIITFKALGISAGNTVHQNDRKALESKDLPPEVEDMLGQFAKELADNRALVEELRATITTLQEQPPKKVETIQSNVKTQGPEKEAKVLTVLGAGLFRSGQVVIDESMMNAVEGLVPELLASPGSRVMIEGHTDSMPIKLSAGTQYRDNMELSFLRAKEVALILENNGIPPERISVSSYGDTRPIASNESEDGRVKNRRVVVKLIPEDKEF